MGEAMVLDKAARQNVVKGAVTPPDTACSTSPTMVAATAMDAAAVVIIGVITRVWVQLTFETRCMGVSLQHCKRVRTVERDHGCEAAGLAPQALRGLIVGGGDALLHDAPVDEARVDPQRLH